VESGGFPGRSDYDPRSAPAFKAAVFIDGIETLNDLKPGMVLEVAVTNVAPFGAFVEIGVHRDGLVHVSTMSKTFVRDPREGGNLTFTEHRFEWSAAARAVMSFA
jgi:uncharacterized protein